MYNENEWFNNFLNELSKSANKQDAVKDIVNKYSTDIGLNLLEVDNLPLVIKTASKAAPLSKRAENKISIKDRPEVIEAIDSFCKNSGGTKSIYSILNYLRKLLGKENISYTDNELLDCIKDSKAEYYSPEQATSQVNVGMAGTEHDYADTAADYATRGR